MKTSKWVSLLMLGGACVAAHALPKNIHFDGYCDGITDIRFIRNPGGGLGGSVMLGTWNLDSCGIASTAVAGVTGRNQDQIDITGSYDVAAQGAGFPTLVVRLYAGGTWVYFNSKGKYVNSGTWSEEMPNSNPAASSLPMSVPR